MEDRSTKGWLKADEIRETFADQLETGKVVVIGLKPAADGIQLHLVQHKEGSLDATGKILDIAGYNAVDGSQLRHAWQTVKSDFPLVEAIEKAEAGVLWDDLVLEVLGKENAFTSSIFFSETTIASDIAYMRDGDLILPDPVKRPASTKRPDEGYAFDADGTSPVFRRTNIKADDVEGSTDIILKKVFLGEDKWKTYHDKFLGVVQAEEKLSVEA